MLAIVLLRSLGFVREMALAAVYGAGAVTDAFVVAFTAPNVLLSFISASVATVYIPLYQSHKENKDRFTSNIINLLALTGLVFSLIFTAFPEALVFLFASQLDAETFELAAMMTRIMVWAAVPTLLINIYKGYLEIRGAFFTSQIAYGIVNICIVTSIFFSRSAEMLSLLGAGVTVGNILCVVILVIVCRKHELRYRPYLNLRDSSIKEMLVLVAPVMIATGIGEINSIVDRNFASSLTTGSISSLNYAAKLVNLISALIGVAAATVLFPKMSEFAAGDNRSELKKYLMTCVKKLVPLLLPLTAGAILLAEPLVRILFERGAFTPADTLRTAQCLQMFAVSVFCNSINVLLLRACHAMKDMKAPAVCSAVTVAVNIGLNFLLVAPLQHRGLALSTSTAAVVTTVLLIFVLMRRLGRLGLRRELPEFLKAGFATAVMCGAVFAGYHLLPVMSGSTMLCVIYTVELVLGGAALYFLLHKIMRSSFSRDVTDVLHMIFGRKDVNGV